jgi:5-methylcytosine-specific restriction endonuclease McrA
MVIIDPDSGKPVRIGYELAKEYRQAVSPLRGICEHPQLERRARGTAEVDQCLACGSQKGGAFKQSESFGSLPKFDEGLAGRRDAEKEAQREIIDRDFVARERAEHSNQVAGPTEGDFQYAAYLRSPAWQRRRSLVLNRAKGICEGCMENKATEVHHRTYDQIGNELLYDLVALCRSCHLKAHPEHRNREDLYEDYSVCTNCRYDGGGVYCHRFDVAAHEAFTPGGGCFPPGAAFEGLK